MPLNQWTIEAIDAIERDFTRSADTHLLPFSVSGKNDIRLYIKDESTHPTGSLKHRLARSLFLYALCNGNIQEGMTITEASSGSTAVSEAYFAQMLGLPFVAVMPRSTAKAKIDKIEFYGGRCHFVDHSDEVYQEAQRLADECGGYYMDQFTYAERATDWRGNNNIAESIFEQMQAEEHAEPSWVVIGAGTGGTSATIGRYIRYRKLSTQLCVVDPENSIFMRYYKSGDKSLTTEQSSRIEGIGRPRVEPSFVRTVIDRMLQIPDADSIAAVHYIKKVLGFAFGPSTGTAFCGALTLATEMRAAHQAGSLVIIAGDAGNRYLDTCYNADWLKAEGYDLQGCMTRIAQQSASVF